MRECCGSARRFVMHITDRHDQVRIYQSCAIRDSNSNKSSFKHVGLDRDLQGHVASLVTWPFDLPSDINCIIYSLIAMARWISVFERLKLNLLDQQHHMILKVTVAAQICRPKGKLDFQYYYYYCKVFARLAAIVFPVWVPGLALVASNAALWRC